MASGRDLVREWLFEYACRHHMPGVLHEIALYHNSIWTEELWCIPPIFPMMAVVHDVVISGVEEKYSYVLDIINELYERTTSFVEYSIYAKLSVALKILVLFRMLRNSDKLVLPRLNAYFPRSGFHNPNADANTEKHLNHGQLEFRKFFLRLIANESVRKAYMETEFQNEYGDVFMLRLKELVRRFLNAIETSLPQPVIDMILNSPPDSALIRELMSSQSTSVEILLDATTGRNLLTEAQVLEVLQNLQGGNASLQMDRFRGLGINLLMSPIDQEPEHMRNGDLSKTGNTSNKNRKRKADEKFEDGNGSDNCSRETGERGRAGNLLHLQKRARISRGDNELVEGDESRSAYEVQNGRVGGLQDTVQTSTGMNFTGSGDGLDNCHSKPTKPRNDNEDNSNNRRSKPTQDKDSCGLRSSTVLRSFHQRPEIKRRPVAVDRHSQRSATSYGIHRRASDANRKPKRQVYSVRDKGDGLVEEAEDVEPKEELEGDSDNCSPPSLESGKEEVCSYESPLREDAIPDTPLHEQGMKGLYTVTVEGDEETIVDDRSYVTDSEDLQSYATAQEEIIPSSYSFDKFDLVVRDVLPTVYLPLLEKYVHPSRRLCVVKMISEFNYTEANGNKLTIFC